MPDHCSAIVLQTMWRSGGSWLWAGFRNLSSCRAYCEPLHESLATCTTEDLENNFVGATRNLRHPDLDVNYFDEYPLRHGGGVALFPSKSPLEQFIQNADEDDEETAQYLERLAGYATLRGELPVFKFCRAAIRAQWLRRVMPQSQFLYLNRNPDDLHRSYWSQGGATNYFSVQYVAALLLHRHRPELREAADWLLGSEVARADALPLNAAEALPVAREICRRSNAQFSRNVTLLFWTLSLMDNIKAKNPIADYDSLVEEPAAIASLIESFRTISNVAPLPEAAHRAPQPEVDGQVVDRQFAERVVADLGASQLQQLAEETTQLHAHSRQIVELLSMAGPKRSGKCWPLNNGKPMDNDTMSTLHPNNGQRTRVDELKSVFDFDARRQHAYNKIQWHSADGKRGRFLDIGCGPGNGIVAALQHGFSTVVGVDRNLHEFESFDIELDDLCRAYDVDASNAILVQGDIETVRFAPKSFDCVLLLDSIEHVPSPKKFIKYAADHVAKGGVVIMDTCPLYFSKAGAHLFNYFDALELPWVHLRKDFADLVEERRIDPWTMQRFHELNRVTNDELQEFFLECGLEITSMHRSEPTDLDLAMLDRHRDMLQLDGVEERTLFEDWVLMVGMKP